MATNTQITQVQKDLEDLETNNTEYTKYAIPTNFIKDSTKTVLIEKTETKLPDEDVKDWESFSAWEKRQIYHDNLSRMLKDLFEEIKHGDQEHQDWLKNKIEEFKQKQLK